MSVYRNPALADGYCLVWVLDGNGSYELPASAFEEITGALDVGLEWWQGENLYGSIVRLRISRVESYILKSATSIAREWDAEDVALAHQALQG